MVVVVVLVPIVWTTTTTATASAPLAPSSQDQGRFKTPGKNPSCLPREKREEKTNLPPSFSPVVLFLLHSLAGKKPPSQLVCLKTDFSSLLKSQKVAYIIWLRPEWGPPRLAPAFMVCVCMCINLCDMKPKGLKMSWACVGEYVSQKKKLGAFYPQFQTEEQQ